MNIPDTPSVFAESIVDTIREGLIVLDHGLRVISASRSFYKQFLVTPGETEGRLIYELGNHQWDIPRLRELLEAIITGQTTIEGFEVKHHFERIGEKVMLLNARRLEHESGSTGMILLAIEDVTEQYTTRQKLAESEEKYRKFVEEINSIIIGFDRNGAITFFNHFAEKLFGYSRNEAVGKPFVGTIIPFVDSKGRDNRSICVEIFTDPGKYYANESEGVRKDGARILFFWSAKAVRDDSGRITEILIDGNDITELSVAQKELEENSAQLKNERDFVNAVIQTSGALITVVDRNGKITRFNKACEELTGYTENEAMKHSLFDLFIPPEERDDVIAVAERLLSGESRVDHENHWITKSGEKRYIRWRNSNLPDFNGVPAYAVATGIDITDRKRAEDALRESETSLKRAQEMAHLGNWELDLVANRLTWSDEIYRIFGLNPLEFVTTYEAFLDCVHPDDRAAVDAAYTGSLQEGMDSYEIDHRVIRKTSGEIRYVHEKCEHVRDANGKIIRSIGMVHDITDRKKIENALLRRTEELAAAYNELESFSSSVSHDLRTPLTAIKGFTDIFIKDYGNKLDDHAKVIFKYIVNAADKMASIIHDLLSLARISKEKMNCQEIDLSPVANRVVNDLRQSEPQRNVRINIADALPTFADQRYATITLENLIGNAWKYTGKNPDARIDIGIIKENNQDVFFIRDNGAGFDMNLSYKLFQPFQRLHSESDFTGTGIGLAIVNRIIQRHGGRIWAESMPGRGSVFYFTLRCTR